jgi:toxin CcdB
MARFDVYQNKNVASSKQFPYLLSVQSDLLDALNTCVVVPLGKAASVGGKPMATLMPGLNVNGASWTMYTPELAAIPTRILGKPVDNLQPQREAIQNALDFLFSGI